MNKKQIKDAERCERLAEQGKDIDCLGCSCRVCIAQEEKKEFTANDYQKAALRTVNKETKDLILNGALGLCGESGEVADIIKKHLFQGHELDKEKIIKELGDVCWYIAITAEGIGIDLETVMKKNIEKLIKRYPDGFETSKSINREE